MIIPPYLKTGDCIRVVSPAGKIDTNKVLPGIDLVRKEGFDVVTGEHALDRYFQFSGTEQQRLTDLQTALDDEKCKAIFCARGGYGTIRIADKINFSSFRRSPKWLVGFSDITVLHCQLQKQNIASIHGAMPGFYLKEGKPTESYETLIQTLKGKKQSFKFGQHYLNRNGNCSGQLTGGNLSILYSLIGTPYEPDTTGKILFIEDLSEYLYHLDRTMHSLKLAGKLDQLAGLVVGGFSEMKDNDSRFGQTVEEIIFDAVKEHSFPVCFDFPAGHIEKNLPLVIGGTYELNVSDKPGLIRVL